MKWSWMRLSSPRWPDSFTVLIRCACYSPDHSLILSYHNSDPDGPDDLYISTHLAQFRFFKRLWVALKYIFNMSGNFFHFEETMLDYTSAVEFRDALDKFIKMEKAKEDAAITKDIPNLDPKTTIV
jgi:hypothetical protein